MDVGLAMSSLLLFHHSDNLCLRYGTQIELGSHYAKRPLYVFLFLFVCVEVLRPSQQLRSCRAGQLPINTVPGQA